MVFHHAVEALKAFRHHDFAGTLDRLDRAGPFAQVAGAAALGAPLEQFDKVKAVENRKCSPERAEKTAKGAFGEQSYQQQDHRIDHIGQATHEHCGDCRLEWLDLFGGGDSRGGDDHEQQDHPKCYILAAP